MHNCAVPWVGPSLSARSSGLSSASWKGLRLAVPLGRVRAGSVRVGRNAHCRAGLMTTEALRVQSEHQGNFVKFFREATPYIQAFRGSKFVIVIPGEVIADSGVIDGILQDVALLHGLGIKLVIVPGTHVQIDELLRERGHQAKYVGAYRITDAAALKASQEAAGKIRVNIEAHLSRFPSIPILRRHGDNERWHEVGISVASGNYVAAKRRGVVDGVDFEATGEVKKIDVVRIREGLSNNSIVLLSNLGYSASGEVLNCNTYEVATACAVALDADKLLCLLDGPVFDENDRLLRFLSLHDADKLIRNLASQSYAAADYVKAVAGSDYVKSLGIETSQKEKQKANGRVTNGSLFGQKRNGSIGNGSPSCKGPRNSSADREQGHSPSESKAEGFAIGGEERLSRTYGYLSELTAAVYVCRAGVRRVHLLDSTVEGTLLLELYTRDGSGTMISSDKYEGTRAATISDIAGIEKLLRPLEESGVLVNRPREQLLEDLHAYTVVERDGSIIACAALYPYPEEKCGEVASFAVAPECRGHGQGDSLLDFLETKAAREGLEYLFLLTTRTADWFVHRGFSPCTIDALPPRRQLSINLARGSKYYRKAIEEPPSDPIVFHRNGRNATGGPRPPQSQPEPKPEPKPDLDPDQENEQPEQDPDPDPEQKPEQEKGPDPEP